MSHLLDMEAFLVVVEEGSFTAAAKRLNVTKSYASKLVSRLEDRIGVHLLQRTTRQLNLTEVGRTYFERCSEAMQVLKAAEAEAVELQSAPQGRLRISLPAVFTVDYLTEPLAEFKARDPKLTRRWRRAGGGRSARCGRAPPRSSLRRCRHQWSASALALKRSGILCIRRAVQALRISRFL